MYKLEQRIKSIKSKTFYHDVEVKEMVTSDDYVEISGYANRYKDTNGNLVVDRDGDSVVPEGMDIVDFQKNPIVLYSHIRTDIVGKAVSVELREEGIWMKMQIFKSLNLKVYEAVRLGVLKTFSIGFSVEDLKYVPELDVFFLTKTNLLEVSLVSIPCNQDSLVETVNVNGTYSLALSSKSADVLGERTPEDITALLKEVRDALDTLKELVKVDAKSEDTKDTITKEDITVEELKGEDLILSHSEEAQEIDGVTKELEVAEVIDKEEIVPPTIAEIASSLAVSADNFDALLGVTELLQAKLNTFLNENIN